MQDGTGRDAAGQPGLTCETKLSGASDNRESLFVLSTVTNRHTVVTTDAPWGRSIPRGGGGVDQY